MGCLSYLYADSIGFDYESSFAKADEIKKHASKVVVTEGQVKAAGFPLFSDGCEMYLSTGEEHCAIEGSTGSGKTRRLMKPAINELIKAGESCCIIDVDQSIYQDSIALARSKKANIIILDFCDFMKGDRWNPFTLAYKYYKSGDSMLKEDGEMLCSEIISIITEEARTRTSDVFWTDSALQFGDGLGKTMMEVFEEEDITLTTLALLGMEQYQEILGNFLSIVPETNPAAAQVRAILCNPEKTLSCVVSTLHSILNPYTANSRIQRALSETSFSFDKCIDQQTIIYLFLPEGGNSFNALVTLFITQLHAFLIKNAKTMSNSQLPIRWNFLLDELCTISPIKDLPIWLASDRKYNVRLNIVYQNYKQLIAHFGEYGASTITSNCLIKYFLNSSDQDTLYEWSQRCGTRIKENGQRVPIIMPEELAQLKMGEMLISYKRFQPYFTEMPDFSKYDYGDVDRTKNVIHPIPFNIVKRPVDIKKVLRLYLDANIPTPFEDIMPVSILAEQLIKKCETTPVEIWEEDETEEEYTEQIQKEFKKKFDEIFGTVSDD